MDVFLRLGGNVSYWEKTKTSQLVGEFTHLVGMSKEFLCKMLKDAGATTCVAEIGARETMPALPDAMKDRKRIFTYSPYKHRSGKALLKRWASLEDLWDKVLEAEVANRLRYHHILVVRDDTFWTAPYVIRGFEFVGDRPPHAMTLT